MFSRIYHFLKGPNPLHPAVCRGRLTPITLRRFVPGDLSQCLELYSRNERDRFPSGMAHEFEEALKRDTTYFLVGEQNGRIVLSGGIEYVAR